MSEWMTGQHLGVLLCIAARSLYGEELPVEWKAAKVDTVTHALEKARERGRARIDTSRRSEWRACEIDMMESWQRVHGTKSVLNWGLGWGFGFFPPLLLPGFLSWTRKEMGKLCSKNDEDVLFKGGSRGILSSNLNLAMDDSAGLDRLE